MYFAISLDRRYDVTVAVCVKVVVAHVRTRLRLAYCRGDCVAMTRVLLTKAATQDIGIKSFVHYKPCDGVNGAACLRTLVRGVTSALQVIGRISERAPSRRPHRWIGWRKAYCRGSRIFDVFLTSAFSCVDVVVAHPVIGVAQAVIAVAGRIPYMCVRQRLGTTGRCHLLAPAAFAHTALAILAQEVRVRLRVFLPVRIHIAVKSVVDILTRRLASLVLILAGRASQAAT